MNQKSRKKSSGLTSCDYLIILCIFLICMFLASLISPSYCPDESARQLLSNWIFEHGTLPTGNEPEVIIPIWNFSYALKPYLSAIIGAFFMRIASFFTSSGAVMLAASRMCSVLSVTGVCYFCLKIGRLMFHSKYSSRLFAVVVCLLPQITFLGSYQNNDSLSLFSVCMIIYFTISGAQNHWKLQSCIGLGFAFSICLLSYYSVYGWIFLSVIFCVVSCLKDNVIQKKASFILKRGSLIFCITAVFAGWFFIRNAILHDGDFLGFATENLSKIALEAEGISPYNNTYLKGYSLIDLFIHSTFVKYTVLSFIGVFGYMNLLMPTYVYIAYLCFFLFGLVLFFIKRHHTKANSLNNALQWLLICGSAISIALHVLQSYFRDFQPQGRYIITVILLFAYLIAAGTDNQNQVKITKNRNRINPGLFLSLIWCALFITSFASSMIKMI